MDVREKEHHETPDILPRKGSVPKTCNEPAPIHGGMSARAQATAGLGGMGHAVGSAPDASAANPLDPTAPEKRLTPVPVTPGMRNRTTVPHDSERGAKVMAEAVESGASKQPKVTGA
jgi:hypothetical protein